MLNVERKNQPMFKQFQTKTIRNLQRMTLKFVGSIFQQLERSRVNVATYKTSYQKIK